MTNEIIARKTVDIRDDEHRKMYPGLPNAFTVDVFESGSALITLGGTRITMMAHADEERLLAIAEALQATVAEARAKRAAATVPACCVGGLCPEHQPVAVLDDDAIAQHDAAERLERSTP